MNRGGTFALSAEEVLIKDVVYNCGKKLRFRCMFNGSILYYTFTAPNTAIADFLSIVLNQSVGNALISIGDTEILQHLLEGESDKL